MIRAREATYFFDGLPKVKARTTEEMPITISAQPAKTTSHTVELTGENRITAPAMIETIA